MANSLVTNVQAGYGSGSIFGTAYKLKGTSTKIRSSFAIISVLFLLSFLLSSCGNSPTSSIEATPTIDPATTAAPTTGQATPTPTIDPATTATSTTSQATPTPTIGKVTAVPPTPTIDQAIATPTPTPTATLDPTTPTPPPYMIHVNPDTLNPSTCTKTTTGWDCSVTIQGIGAYISWSITSPDLPSADLAYSPPSGTLDAGNNDQQTVMISISSVICQNSSAGTFVFTSGAEPDLFQTTVSWSCS